MAVTRLKRKERRNKTTARVRVENIKLHKSRLFVKSPYADESGIIIEDGVESTPVAVAPAPVAVQEDATPEVEASSETAETAEAADSTDAAE